MTLPPPALSNRAELTLAARMQAFLSTPLGWFAVALAVRLLYLVEQFIVSPLFFQVLLDEQESVATARSILSGQGFGPEPLFKAPLYGLLLAGVMALTGEAWWVTMRLLQHAMGAALVAAAFDAARLMAGSGRFGIVAGVTAAGLLAFNGPVIRLEHQLLLDGPVYILQGLMLWALIRLMHAHGLRTCLAWAGAAGLLAAMAWLTRPTITPVLPLLALFVLLRGAPWRVLRLRRWQPLTVMAFVMPACAAVLAFGLRNQLVTGEFLLLPWQGGFNFHAANHREANGRYFLQTDFVVTSHDDANPTRQLALRPFTNHASFTYRQVNAYWMNEARREILADPARWLGLMVQKGVLLFTDREIFNIEVYEIQRGLSVVLTLMPFTFGWLWVIVLAGLPFMGWWPRRSRRDAALCWLMVLALGGAIALYFVSGRMRMPIVFPLALLAGLSVARYARIDFKAWPPRRAMLVHGLGALMLLGGIAWSWGDWWGVRSEDLRHAEYARLSQAAFLDQRAEMALHYAQLLHKLRPDYPQAPQLLAQAAYANGDIETARVQFLQSMQRLPSDPTAPFNLAIIHTQFLRQHQAALAFLAETLRRNPEHPRARFYMPLVTARMGRVAEAQNQLQWMRNIPDDRAPIELMMARALVAHQRNDQRAFTQLQRVIAARFGERGVRQLEDDIAQLPVGSGAPTAAPESATP